MDTAGHNIANAQTEGYSRQRVNLEQRTPSETRGNIIGNGVFVQAVTRSHDKFIEKQLNLATQDASMNETRHNALSGIEQIYSTEMHSSISDEITDFFNALQTLSSNPEEGPVRTAVREAGQDLVSAFQRVDFNLKRNQKDLDQQVQGVAKEINDLCKNIADLNVGITTMEAGRTGTANDLRDQQEQMVRTLSEKIDVNYYTNEHGAMVVRGPQQSLLVDGKLAAHVTSAFGDEGASQLLVLDSENQHPKDIAAFVSRGQMKALLDVRDRVIPTLLQRNNELAVNLSEEVNAIHRQGFGLGDYKETIGRDFFTIDGDYKDAAAQIKIAASISDDINAISAASSPSAPGDNVIANEMLRLKTKTTMDKGSMNFNEYYSNYVSMLGLDVQRTENQLQASKVIEGDLSKRREAVSGVSLDEEAVNLLRWQTAFAASSKVITTTDEMLDTILSLKR